MRRHPAVRTPEFDAVIDEWPQGANGAALGSLIDSGDVIATELPRGFLGLKITRSKLLVFVEADQWHVKHIDAVSEANPTRYRRTGTAPGRFRTSVSRPDGADTLS